LKFEIDPETLKSQNLRNPETFIFNFKTLVPKKPGNLESFYWRFLSHQGQKKRLLLKFKMAAKI
jgi:hypothetical protein